MQAPDLHPAHPGLRDLSGEDAPPVQEETLDPQDWQASRGLAHRMLDDMFDYLETVRQRPVWQPVPEEVRAGFHSPLPQEPTPLEQVYAEFQERILPYPMGNIHPRFWGWVMGNGTVTAMLADMLASAMNPNMGGANHVGMDVENQVLDWMKEIMGFPAEASGLLVSGGSMANLVGLAVARQAAAGPAVRSEGLRGLERQMTVYASAETHSSVQKAVELLGLGSRFLRKIPVNEQYQVDVKALRAAIQADRQAFLQPICVVGNAGTVNTGAIDDLNALADVCQAEGLWFHVDGAIGALARLAPSLLPAMAGVERADSVAFDLHKWLYLPFEIGGVLVRNADLHHDTFALMPAYLARSGGRGLASGASWFSEYGVQLSRGFRALKAWMSIKENGAARFGRLMEQNVAQAQYLAGRVQETPGLELCAPVPLNIVCFRYTSPGLDEPALNALNQELLIRLHESGVAVPTYTTLNGRYMLRAAITNHRSRREDFDLLVEAVVNLGSELVREGAGG